ncbi:MAG TPA: ATP-binding protein [Steroidobacteraceae bacterium]|nr:ATP-binding protein [Steroidobacteraceae bacterium]
MADLYWGRSAPRRWQLVAAAPVQSPPRSDAVHGSNGPQMSKTPTVAAHQRQARKQSHEQQQQLAHLDRVAVLGGLAGAFAHELAQPLTSILANAEAALQIALREAAVPGEIRDILKDIIRDDVRAAEMIRRLRTLLAPGKASRQSVDLNDIVQDVLTLVRADLLARGVAVTLQLTSQEARVLADAVQLQQVLLNLIVNGCEAMSGKACSERRLTIATRVLQDGRTIECSVRDRGHGISGEALERIFEPFVTTRPQGLGLGLAICRSIVAAHGGRLAAANAPDCGAVFHFTLRRRRFSYAGLRAITPK